MRGGVRFGTVQTYRGQAGKEKWKKGLCLSLSKEPEREVEKVAGNGAQDHITVIVPRDPGGRFWSGASLHLVNANRPGDGAIRSDAAREQADRTREKYWASASDICSRGHNNKTPSQSASHYRFSHNAAGPGTQISVCLWRMLSCPSNLLKTFTYTESKLAQSMKTPLMFNLRANHLNTFVLKLLRGENTLLFTKLRLHSIICFFANCSFTAYLSSLFTTSCSSCFIGLTSAKSIP